MELRRTLLFIPGNNPAMLQNGGVFGADSLIFDLEDSVHPEEKDAARLLVAQALKYIEYGTSERIIRINSLDTYARQDIRTIVPCHPDAILLPKAESSEHIKEALYYITQFEENGQKPVQLIALVETPRGIAEAYSIAKTDKRVVALAFGAEDYTTVLGAKRTREGTEIFTARTMLVNAAAAAGIQAIDTPFVDAYDEHGLLQDSLLAKNLGFKGKLTINPRQIDIIHSVFNPSEADIEWARQVMLAVKKADLEGMGVASISGKMIDAPIASRAEQILQLATKVNAVQEEAHEKLR